jgi:hypothetical protein
MGEAERTNLEQRVRLLHHALVLQGCAYNSGAIMVQGYTWHGHLHVGPISPTWVPCHRPEYRRYKRVGASQLRVAKTILLSLEHVYGHAPGPDYRRIRKGFNSWIRAIESPDIAERLHSFVRAAEAVIRPTTTTRPYRQIARTFTTRGLTFVGQSRQNERLLKQLYDLRSCIEHIKDIMPQVHKPRGIPRAEAFAFRALQAEILASTIYQRIFTSDTLREQLRTELRVEGYWRRSFENRRMPWGRSLDLSAAARRQFISTLTLDLL